MNSSENFRDLSPEDKGEVQGPSEKEVSDRADYYLNMVLGGGPGSQIMVRDALTEIKAVIEKDSWTLENEPDLVEKYKKWTMEDYKKLEDKIVEGFKEKIGIKSNK